MQYMMLIYLDEHSLTESQRETCYRDSAEYAQQLAASGKCTVAAPLHLTATATSLRFQEGKRVVTDGPFAETREQVGGIFLVEAANLDEAMEIASRIPAGRWGTVEIRPVIDVPGVPQNSSRVVDSRTPHPT